MSVARKKTAGKRAVPSKVRQPHGGALLTGGVPGNKGGTGRPPNWLKEFCDDLLADKKAKAQVRAIMKDKDHPAYATMWKALADRAAGKPVQAHEHRLGATLEELVSGSMEKKPE